MTRQNQTIPLVPTWSPLADASRRRDGSSTALGYGRSTSPLTTAAGFEGQPAAPPISGVGLLRPTADIVKSSERQRRVINYDTGCCAAASDMHTHVPAPTSLSIVNLPSIPSISRFDSARPTPVPEFSGRVTVAGRFPV